jgi:Putative Ig domain
MSRSHPLTIPPGLVAACLAVAAVALALPAGALGAVNVTRAELKSGQLRVEGRGALPGATITITSDSTATGRADAAGAFRVEASGYASSTCRVTVSDGASSAEVALAECTPSAASPSPTPTPDPTPSSTLVIVDDVLPNGNVGTAYSGSLFSRGAEGDKPVEYRVVSGRLPAGLSMTRSFGVASALITGTPTTVGTSSFTVEARDGSGQTARKSFSITIEPPLPLVITNISDQLAPGTVGIEYQIQLFANGGIRPYSWSTVAGQLPPGLSLSSSGRISGMPVSTGTFAFTARATDESGAQATRQFSIAVSR